MGIVFPQNSLFFLPLGIQVLKWPWVGLQPPQVAPLSETCVGANKQELKQHVNSRGLSNRLLYLGKTLSQ